MRHSSRRIIACAGDTKCGPRRSIARNEGTAAYADTGDKRGTGDKETQVIISVAVKKGSAADGQPNVRIRRVSSESGSDSDSDSDSD